MIYRDRISIWPHRRKLADSGDNPKIRLILSRPIWGGSFDGQREWAYLLDHSIFGIQMQALIFFRRRPTLALASGTQPFSKACLMFFLRYRAPCCALQAILRGYAREWVRGMFP